MPKVSPVLFSKYLPCKKGKEFTLTLSVPGGLNKSSQKKVNELLDRLLSDLDKVIL
jgi:hypothetical protein